MTKSQPVIQAWTTRQELIKPLKPFINIVGLMVLVLIIIQNPVIA